MGLSPASMKGALKQRVESTGVICRTVTEAMELVFDYEEEQRRNNNAKNNSHDGLVITEEVGFNYTVVDPWDYMDVHLVSRILYILTVL